MFAGKNGGKKSGNIGGRDTRNKILLSTSDRSEHSGSESAEESLSAAAKKPQTAEEKSRSRRGIDSETEAFRAQAARIALESAKKKKAKRKRKNSIEGK